MIMEKLGRLDLATPRQTEGKIMAGLPSVTGNKTPKSDAPTPTPPAESNGSGDKQFPTNLEFTDVDQMPESATLAAASNPFQDKVNELARTGKASSWTGPTDQMDWARDQIRRAANNIDKGAKTRVVPAKDQNGKNMQSTSVVWFTVQAKRKRTTKG